MQERKNDIESTVNQPEINWQVDAAINIVKTKFKPLLNTPLKVKEMMKYHKIFINNLQSSLSLIFTETNKVAKMDLMANILVLDSFEKRMKLYLNNIKNFSNMSTKSIKNQYKKIFYDILDIYLICIVVASKACLDASPTLDEYIPIYQKLHEDCISEENLIKLFKQINKVNYFRFFHIPSASNESIKISYLIPFKPFREMEISHLKMLNYKVALFTQVRMYSLLKEYVSEQMQDEVDNELKSLGLR